MLTQALDHLLRQLEEMPHFLAQGFEALPRELLTRTPPNGDKSPLLEHLWHVRDCDSDLYGLRIARVLSEDSPTLAFADVRAWPVQRQYEQRSGDQAISEFTALRTALVQRLRELAPADLARSGVRADGQVLSVLDLIEQIADHDRDHRWRMTAILRSCLTC